MCISTFNKNDQNSINHIMKPIKRYLNCLKEPKEMPKLIDQIQIEISIEPTTCEDLNARFALYFVESNHCILKPIQQIYIEYLYENKKSQKIFVSEGLWVNLEKMEIYKQEKIYKIERKILTLKLNDCFYFWQSNLNPFDESQDINWTPYDIKNQLLLIQATLMTENSIFKSTERIKLEDIPYEVCLEKQLQYFKSETFRQRPIKRMEISSVSNLIRFHPYITDKLLKNNSNSTWKFLKSNNNKNQLHDEIAALVIDYSYCIRVSHNAIIVKSKIKLDVKELLSNQTFDELKLQLKKEIIELASSEKDFIFMPFYFAYINSLEYSQTMFDTIIDLFCMEGFLRSNMNKILSTKRISAIKYLYLFLLIGFDNAKLQEKQEEFEGSPIKLYHLFNSSSDTEVEVLKTNLASGNICIRIFNEFLCTTTDGRQLHSINTNENEYKLLYEIEVDSKYSNSRDLLFMKHNKRLNFIQEVLIRSGAAMEIFEVKRKEQSRTYIVKARLIASPEVNLYVEDRLCTYIDLEGILKNNNNIVEVIISRLLSSNQVTKICLAENNLGESPERMKFLQNLLKAGSSITYLDLKGNSLGSNAESIKIINEAISSYPNLQILDLRFNSLETEMIIQNNASLKIYL